MLLLSLDNNVVMSGMISEVVGEVTRSLKSEIFVEVSFVEVLLHVVLSLKF